jgi:hypothetical protein
MYVRPKTSAGFSHIIDLTTREVNVLRLQYLHNGNTQTDSSEAHQGRCSCKQSRAKKEPKHHPYNSQVGPTHKNPLLQSHEQTYIIKHLKSSKKSINTKSD